MKKGSTHAILISAFFVVVFGALFFIFSMMKEGQTPTAASVVEFTPSVVAVMGVSPSSVFQGAAVQLNISGVDFNSSAVLFIENVSVLSIIVVNDTLIEANISIPITAGDGVYDVNITQDGENASLIGGLTILEGPFDPSTLTNVTPASGYINNSDIINLTYNISTAFGVDYSLVSIVEGYIEIKNLNTSSETILNLTNWTSAGEIFTMMFAEHNYSEDGDYAGEIYVNISVNGTIVEHEYYSYFGVGDVGCFFAAGTCHFNATVGTPFSIAIPIFAASPPITSCSFTVGFPPGCSVAPGPGAACTINCTPTTAGFFSWTLNAVDPPPCFPAACIANITGSPPPPPSLGGGGGGGSNPYPPRDCCCQLGPLKGEILSGRDCLNAPSNKRCDRSTQNINDAACKQPAPVSIVAPPPKPKLVVQAPAPQPPVTEQNNVHTQAAPPRAPPVSKEVQKPVAIEKTSSQSIVLAVLAVLIIIAGLVYLQFFYKHKR